MHAADGVAAAAAAAAAALPPRHSSLPPRRPVAPPLALAAQRAGSCSTYYGSTFYGYTLAVQDIQNLLFPTYDKETVSTLDTKPVYSRGVDGEPRQA